MIDFSNFNSIISVIRHFSSEKVCRQALAEARWKDDAVCPHCGKHHCVKRTDGRFRCNRCKHNFSCTTGTIFENTNLSLQKVVHRHVPYLLTQEGCLLPSDSEGLRGHSETAWYMLQKIRTLFAQDDSVALDGEIEADEMYLGGREINKHESKRTAGTQGRSTKTKTPIFEMVEREKGKAVVIKVEDTRAKTLMPIIKQFVKDNAHIFTDELTSYSGLSKEGYIHDVIQHELRMYSNGKGVTTNRIKGFGGGTSRGWFSEYTIR